MRGSTRRSRDLLSFPGLEVCGRVIESACCDVTVGDRVYCLFSGSGGYSEECVTEGSHCFRVPEVWESVV